MQQLCYEKLQHIVVNLRGMRRFEDICKWMWLHGMTYVKELLNEVSQYLREGEGAEMTFEVWVYANFCIAAGDATKIIKFCVKGVMTNEVLCSEFFHLMIFNFQFSNRKINGWATTKYRIHKIRNIWNQNLELKWIPLLGSAGDLL